MPRPRSAASRCSTVSTDASSRDRAGLQLLPAAQVGHRGRNLDAAQVRPPEPNAVIGRRRLQRQTSPCGRNEGQFRRSGPFDEGFAAPTSVFDRLTAAT